MSTGWFRPRWRICLEKPPTCSDGLELIPVAILDCPSSGMDLTNCHDAEPGELCEGDGRCGTRKDINNCYDKFQTYPPSRDVYQKGIGTTRTSTSSMTMTRTKTSFYWYSRKKYSVYSKELGTTRTITTSTTTTVPFVFMVDDGPCAIRHGCVRSPGFPNADLKHESCQISLSPAADLRLAEFRNCTLEP